MIDRKLKNMSRWIRTGFPDPINRYGVKLKYKAYSVNKKWSYNNKSSMLVEIDTLELHVIGWDSADD
jgi:hypothetical protein